MKLKPVIITSVTLLIILIVIVFIKSQTKAQVINSEPISAQYTDTSLFLSPIKQSQIKPATVKIAGLIVPHHLLAKDVMANTYAYAAKGQYKNIVILSTDHFSAGKTEVSTTERDFGTVFGLVSSDKTITHKLKSLSFVSEGNFFYREHGLGAQLPFIKYYFPQAKVVAITFKPTTSQDKLDQVIKMLKDNLPPNSLIIQSTDFSHYLTPTEADLKDVETISAINNNDVLKLRQPENIDSRAALYIESSLQADFFKTTPVVLEHKNSQAYTKEPVTSSTSYVSVAYQKNTGDAEFIFVGDVMLSRNIASSKNPFELISPQLNQADLVFGNLENPVSSKGQETGHMYSLRANPEVLPNLKTAGFTVLSVANNHAFDYGLEAFTDTLNNLKQNNLAYTGGGNNFSEAHGGAYQEINGIRTTILSYTDLLPKSEAATDTQAGVAYLDEAQMTQDIKTAKAKSDLVIVSFHWGKEYDTKSNEHQQKIAAAAVKAGADLIIGHHPHVVQEVMELHGVPVAYSLGNFIFDQNFSKETSTGLMLKVTIKDKKIIKTQPQTIKFKANFSPYIE